ncbi:MAG: histidine phosphatase family protein [Alphaproteobacteria bacterium]
MKTLYVLRHAKSSWADPDSADLDRPLAPRGERAAMVMGRYIAQQDMIPELILCSTARRAVETRAAVVGQWPAVPPTEFDEALYLAGATGVIRRLARVDAAIGGMLVIGHNPDLHALTVGLAKVGPADLIDMVAGRFPTGAFAALTLPIERWDAISEAAGTLTDFVVPKMLV